MIDGDRIAYLTVHIRREDGALSAHTFLHEDWNGLKSAGLSSWIVVPVARLGAIAPFRSSLGSVCAAIVGGDCRYRASK